MAPQRRAFVLTVLLAGCALVAGCQRGGGLADGLAITWRLPDQPVIAQAPAVVGFALRDKTGAPVRAALLTLEGHMSHPGMPPLSAPVMERNGVYEGFLRFPMAGDWKLVMTGMLPDGTRITFEQPFVVTGGAPSP